MEVPSRKHLQLQARHTILGTPGTYLPTYRPTYLGAGTLHVTTVLLYYCTTVLLYYCITVSLYYCKCHKSPGTQRIPSTGMVWQVKVSRTRCKSCTYYHVRWVCRPRVPTTEIIWNQSCPSNARCPPLLFFWSSCPACPPIRTPYHKCIVISHPTPYKQQILNTFKARKNHPSFTQVRPPSNSLPDTFRGKPAKARPA